ncbi:Phosphatidylinositide phosphatase SAC1 [Binucleata daphniae]
MKYFLETNDESITIYNDDYILTAIKETGKVNIQKNKTQQKSSKTKQTKGVYGLLELKNRSYLVCVEKAEICGKIKDNEIYEIKKVNIVPYMILDKNLDDTNDLKILKKSFEVPGLYYSKYKLHKSYYEQQNADNTFLYNDKPLQNLKQAVDNNDIDFFTLNCIQGYVNVSKFTNYNAVLISRRCPKRVGMRYLLRGANKNGYCANFVETEQILYDTNNTNSFVQIRGSIPLMWGHKLSLKWNPTVTYQDSNIINKAHEITQNLYKNVHYLNLINSKNHEQILKKHYKQELVKHNYDFTDYDYKNNKFATSKDARDMFVADLTKKMDEFGFSTENVKQKGVIRTNCIDCLDRTNIIQFYISQYALKKQIQNLDKNSNECLEAFKDAFVKNGNYLSIQYAGTNSLQSEIITKEKVTIKCKIKDGANSIIRYYKNRFKHGQLQDGYNILTSNTSDMKQVKRKQRINILLYAILLVVLLAFHYFAYKEHKNKNFCFVLLFTTFICLLLIFVLFQDKFLDQPRYIET